MNLDEKKKFIINFIFLAFWITILYLIFKLAFAYLMPFVIGVIIAYSVQKPSYLISKKIKIKQQICAAVLSVLIYVAFVALLILFFWFLYSQISSVLKNFSQIEDFFNNIYQAIKRLLKNFNNNEYGNFFEEVSKNTVDNFAEKLSGLLTEFLTDLIKNMPQLLISGIITVVATCYIAKDYNKLVSFLKGFLSVQFINRAVEVISIFKECVLKFFLGYFWIFILTFAELVIGFFAIGVSNTFLIAFIVALIDILPVLGAGTVLLPWTVFNFINGDFGLGIGLLLLYVIITIIRNFIEPKIIGKQIDINPIFTLIFFFLGLRLGGFFGMLIFPITLTVVFTYYRRKFLTDKV